MSELTPKQIVAELDKYIIGQDKAKKSVAVALRDRYRTVSYTHLRAHETVLDLVCRLLLEKKN